VARVIRGARFAVRTRAGSGARGARAGPPCELALKVYARAAAAAAAAAPHAAAARAAGGGAPPRAAARQRAAARGVLELLSVG
jgi:hypothetical protein